MPDFFWVCQCDRVIFGADPNARNGCGKAGFCVSFPRSYKNGNKKRVALYSVYLATVLFGDQTRRRVHTQGNYRGSRRRDANRGPLKIMGAVDKLAAICEEHSQSPFSDEDFIENVNAALSKKKTFPKYPGGAFHHNVQRLAGMMIYFLHRLPADSQSLPAHVAIELADHIKVKQLSLQQRWDKHMKKSTKAVTTRQKSIATKVIEFFAAKELQDDSIRFPCFGSDGKGCPHSSQVSINDGERAHDESIASQFARKPSYYLCRSCNLMQFSKSLKVFF
jgi:hypothetical protein